MPPFEGFIAGSYVDGVFQADAERSMNWLPSKIESPSGKTKTGWVLIPRPGLVRFTRLSTPDFAISVAPSSRAEVDVGTFHFTVTIAGNGGFAGAVALSAVSTPADHISFAFTPTPVTGGSGTSDLAVTVTEIKVDGYLVTITGTSGELVHTAQCAVLFIV